MRAASLGIAALLALPLAVGEYGAYQLALVFLYALAAMGIGLCWGRAGFLPLGQALFFGLAAYASGLALTRLDAGPAALALLPLAMLAPGLLAFGIGLLVFRRGRESGPYFSMITLALALLGYQVANNWESVTGGFNGLKSIPGLPGADGFVDAYYVAAGALVLGSLLLGWLYRAPLGVLWAALSQNERRVALLGFDTGRLKAVAFGASGVLAGIAGALYAPQQGLVTPQAVGFLLSADLVIWAAVGGRHRLLGPALGAVALGLLTSDLRDRFAWWEILVAVFFIAVVLLFPQGLAGLFEPLRRRLARRGRGAPVEADPPAWRGGASPMRAGAGGRMEGGDAGDDAGGDAGGDAPVLEIDAVDVGFGGVAILAALSLRIDRPGIYCLIGPNGAGKTSAFNMLTGELPTRAGSSRFEGRTITGLPPHRVARLGLGRKLQIPSVFPQLPIADHLAIALWSGRASALDLLRPRLRRWSSPMMRALQQRYPFLADGERTAAQLSHGERQILELAMAILGEPRLLLLDEPCAGLSPAETAAVIDVIRWAAERTRATVVVIEHDMSLVRELADVVFVLHNGALLAQGSVQVVKDDPAVQAVYVGADK